MKITRRTKTNVSNNKNYKLKKGQTQSTNLNSFENKIQTTAK